MVQACGRGECIGTSIADMIRPSIDTNATRQSGRTFFFSGVPSKIEVAGENKPSGAGAMVMQVEHDPGGSQSRITG
jgi:hypothetical protein